MGRDSRSRVCGVDWLPAPAPPLLMPPLLHTDTLAPPPNAAAITLEGPAGDTDIEDMPVEDGVAVDDTLCANEC